jgi:hypothetical protein
MCENACATSDAYKLEPLIKDNRSGSYNPGKQLKIINTGTIAKYCSRWGIKEMTYLKQKYLYPVVDKAEFSCLFNNTYSKKSVRPKIIIKGLNLLDGCLDENGSIIPGKTTLIITASQSSDLKLLLAIINSHLPLFYIREKYPASSYNQGTTFTKEMINEIPIPNISAKHREELIALVESILTISLALDYFSNPDKQRRVSVLESKINQLVYRLYDLTPEEIAVVEGKT